MLLELDSVESPFQEAARRPLHSETRDRPGCTEARQRTVHVGPKSRITRTAPRCAQEPWGMSPESAQVPGWALQRRVRVDDFCKLATIILYDGHSRSRPQDSPPLVLGSCNLYMQSASGVAFKQLPGCESLASLRDAAPRGNQIQAVRHQGVHSFGAWLQIWAARKAP